MQKMKATLILENGMTFAGRSIGSGEERICEMVFNTSMTGYQEILTDPSYAGQGIVMSYPLIGNYGVNHEDNESFRPWAEAFIVRHLARRGSNFRCEDGLDSYLKQFNITGIEGVDTRALTRILRSQGTMNGMITCAEHFSVPECLERIRAYRVEGTVERVTRKEPQVYPAAGGQQLRVALMDYGVKENMIRCLQNRGCEVTVFPAHTPAETVLSGGFDGVMLSNGPGDPADNVEIIAEVRKLYESALPLFAVCLGHQLLALATGAETRKMRFGHRGGNHPVKDLEHGRAYITSQNHGYVVTAESVDPAVAEEQLARLHLYTDLPLIAEPSAGLPDLASGKPDYPDNADAFARRTPQWAAAGVRIFGGCCGTAPAHIAALGRAMATVDFSAFPPVEKDPDVIPCASEKEARFITPDVDVGETIQCTDHLMEDILEAEEERPVGALKIEVLDTDDLEIFAREQYAVRDALCLWSDVPELLEGALRAYQGRAFYDGTAELEPEFLARMSEKYGLILL